MTWTTQFTYTAAGLTDEDTAALAEALGGGADIAYAAGLLQVNLEVEASTLEEAAGSALRTAAAATGLLKPTHLRVLPTAEFLDETAHPAPMNLDLIGITEIAAELGVSRQRAGKLADDRDFPAPVLEPASGRLYTRASVNAFQQRWTATRNPRGGRRPRQPATTAT